MPELKRITQENSHYDNCTRFVEIDDRGLKILLRTNLGGYAVEVNLNETEMGRLYEELTLHFNPV